MNKLTAEEIIELLENGLVTDVDSDDEDYDDYEIYAPGEFLDAVQYSNEEGKLKLGKPKLEEALGKVVYVKKIVDADNYYVHQNILHFVDHDVYLRIDGEYNSYEGYVSYEDSDWGVQVFPREITETVYEKIAT